jgi:WD40 repeat protein
VENPHSSAFVLFSGSGDSLVVKERNGQFRIPLRRWRALLEKSSGEAISVTVRLKESEGWKSYDPFSIFVAKESINPYLVYRLIEPGYAQWNDLGIYQRNLESYRETPLYENKMTDHNCVNCHSFCMQNPDRMLFHMRSVSPGTMVILDGKVEKLNTKTNKTLSPLVYPSWHPSGKYVAFSVNNTQQSFHLNDINTIEVFDNKSDVVVYDVEKEAIATSSLLFSDTSLETYPTFSPDGKTLYFCTAPAVTMPASYDSVHYSLCSIAFDPEKRTFGNRVDTLYNATLEGGSVSFPRVSPDGKYLLFTKAGYGNFSIWHKDADLFLCDLKTGEIRCLDAVNSHDVESYHSWDSGSRWFVFSSRRLDGLYTRLYIAYLDEQGNAGKPFLLPQRNVSFYHLFMKSYNIPELIKKKASLHEYKIARMAKKDPGVNLKTDF